MATQTQSAAFLEARVRQLEAERDDVLLSLRVAQAVIEDLSEEASSAAILKDQRDAAWGLCIVLGLACLGLLVGPHVAKWVQP